MTETPLWAEDGAWDESAIPPRAERGDRPVEMDRTPVLVRGEALHPIWWRGRQWAVTECGIEALDGTYVLDAARVIAEAKGRARVRHVPAKVWVDAEDFATAWLVALAMHGPDGAEVRAALRRFHDQG